MSAGATSWVEVATIWAHVQDILPSRAAVATEAIQITARPTRIRMHWRDDITSAMRIVLGSLGQTDDPPSADRRVLKIIAGPAELGRRQGIELMAEDYSTQGVAA